MSLPVTCTETFKQNFCIKHYFYSLQTKYLLTWTLNPSPQPGQDYWMADRIFDELNICIIYYSSYSLWQMCRTRWHHLTCVKEDKQQQENMRMILISQWCKLQIVTQICDTHYFCRCTSKSASRIWDKTMSTYFSLNHIVHELKQGSKKVPSGCLRQVDFPFEHALFVNLGIVI